MNEFFHALDANLWLFASPHIISFIRFLNAVAIFNLKKCSMIFLFDFLSEMETTSENKL